MVNNNIIYKKKSQKIFVWKSGSLVVNINKKLNKNYKNALRATSCTQCNRMNSTILYFSYVYR